jgi:glycosyltransferase involved in cell wall biosynthesis
MSRHRTRVLFLTKHARTGASSRYRSFQYLPWLEQAGIECQVRPLFDEAYLAHRYQSGRGHVRDILGAFFRRAAALIAARRFDVLVIEKESLPYFPALPERWLRLLGVPYVVDYDDALFHQYDQHRSGWVRRLLGSKIAHVIRDAHLVTAGNAYLADYARCAGAHKVEIVPTVIDLERYPSPNVKPPSDTPFIIGWIGSPSTAKYLQAIAPALAEICAGGRGIVRLIGSGPIDLPGVPVEVLPWDEAAEVDDLKRFDVGIMPLPDEPWERGKCGFKLIQYMACGLPVVASPVGVNRDIVEQGVNGYLAETTAEWARSLSTLLRDAVLRRRMGLAGRQKVEQHYSLQVTGPRLAGLIRSVVDGRKAKASRPNIAGNL